jgi:DNA replication protein DnaC
MIMTPSDVKRLGTQLHQLYLRYIEKHYQALATKAAAEEQRSHVDYLAQLIEGEATIRETRSIERRIKNARFPVFMGRSPKSGNAKSNNRFVVKRCARAAVSTQPKAAFTAKAFQLRSAKYLPSERPPH